MTQTTPSQAVEAADPRAEWIETTKRLFNRWGEDQFITAARAKLGDAPEIIRAKRDQEQASRSAFYAHIISPPAITSQQEVAAHVGEFDDWPDFNEQAMGCGLEDRNITDRYEAMRYGWDEAMERVGERFEQFLAASRVPVASLASREQGVEAVGAVPIGEGFFLPDGTWTGSASKTPGFLRMVEDDEANGCTIRPIYAAPPSSKTQDGLAGATAERDEAIKQAWALTLTAARKGSKGSDAELELVEEVWAIRKFSAHPLASQPKAPAPVPVVQGEAIPEGHVVVPAWKGYALLGTGHYLINHSAEFDPELGAELFITLATDEDRAGDRQIGESRDTREPEKPVQPEDMVIRIGFLSERALFALEDQLRIIRETHFATPPGGAGGEVGAETVLKCDFDHVAADRERGKALLRTITTMLQSKTDHGEILQWLGEKTGAFYTVFATPAPEQATTGSGQGITDAVRLDFMLAHDAFVVNVKLDHPVIRYQCWNQDEDEGYHTLSGENKSFATKREAIDAAILSTASPAGEVKK